MDNYCTVVLFEFECSNIMIILYVLSWEIKCAYKLNV